MRNKNIIAEIDWESRKVYKNVTKFTPKKVELLEQYDIIGVPEITNEKGVEL